MLLSMTGFGKAVAKIPNKKITVEVKSVNSKQLDLTSRVPGIYREKELELRTILASKLERGKVEMQVSVENLSTESAITLNLPLMAAYKAQITEMAQTLGLPEPEDWYAVLMRFPDTVKSESSTTVSEEEAEALIKAVGEAADALMQYRATEGAKLTEFFSARIANIKSLLAQVEPFEKERIAKIRARIEDSLSKLDTTITIDNNRLEQEMIFYIEKLDINEEKQRLTQHLNYFADTLMASAGQGKKLGFISQEMGREINTLGSKSNHAEMQKIVVKMKDELEQIKEQVLNVM